MDSDWDLSDLTELESSEDEYAPKPARKPATPKAQARNKDKEYRINNALRLPRTTSYPADWVYTQITEGLIDLEPSYQREVVWPETKQVGLVDSLLRNYYIPPVIFAVRIQDDGRETRVCIDGKQRLTSIYRFMSGEIKTATRNQLPNQYQQAFRNKQIVCVEYDDLNADQEREIFQRVQLGVPLTPAERMQAICGSWPNLVREIQDNILGKDAFGDNFDWDRTRGREFQCLASIIYLIRERTSRTAPTFPGAVQLERMLQLQTPPSAELREGVLQTFKIYQTLARNPQLSSCFQEPARVSPLEFIMTGLLIFIRRTEFSMSQLSSAIAKMRVDVRQKHTDVRQNTKVSKTMWAFIKRIKASQFQGGGKADVCAAEALAKNNLRETKARTKVLTKPSAKTPTRILKRKRAVVDSDDDDDESLQKPAKIAKPDTQKARRSGTKAAPMKKILSDSSLTAKKPAVANPSKAGVGARASRRSALGDKGSKSASIPATPVPGSSRVDHTGQQSSKSDGVQVDSCQRIASYLPSLSGPAAQTSDIDRLAPIRKAKARQLSNPNIRGIAEPISSQEQVGSVSRSTPPQTSSGVGEDAQVPRLPSVDVESSLGGSTNVQPIETTASRPAPNPLQKGPSPVGLSIASAIGSCSNVSKHGGSGRASPAFARVALPEGDPSNRVANAPTMFTPYPTPPGSLYFPPDQKQEQNGSQATAPSSDCVRSQDPRERRASQVQNTQSQSTQLPQQTELLPTSASRPLLPQDRAPGSYTKTVLATPTGPRALTEASRRVSDDSFRPYSGPPGRGRGRGYGSGSTYTG